ncbi:MAG: MFS transporter, partial [Bifidobacteriaceae bacterium]|nr:MFS transporter [Bifidobacteriaceae bacterium]
MRPYLELLKIPGAAAFCGAGLLARAGGAMMGIGIVMMVSEIYHRYDLAGGISAANVIAWAFGTAFLSNLVDRYGQRRVMLPAVFVSAGALAVLVVFGTMRLPAWTLFAPAAISGAAGGAPGALVRARWNLVVTSPRQLHTAFSLEATLDELSFVVGPVAATILATQVAPSAGLVAPIILSVIGSLWFYSLRATEPPASRPKRPKQAKRPGQLLPADSVGEANADTRSGEAPPPSGGLILAMAGVAPVAVVTMLIGMVFGACDVSVVAATDAWGVKALSGTVLGVFALGSALGGLAYGSRNWVSSVARRWVVGLGFLALAAVMVLFASNPLFLSIAGFAAGLMIAPTMVNLNALMQSLVPSHRLTEGLAWVGTSVGVGVSIGSSLAGQLIDRAGYQFGFAAMLTAAVVAAAVALFSARSVS